MHLVAPKGRRTVSLLVLALIASLIPIVTAPPARAAVAGDIVITEVMQNPSAAEDDAVEWFEVHNTTSSDINLVNWIVSDGGTDTFTIDGNVTVPAGGYAVIGNNDDGNSNGGAPVNFTYDRTIFSLSDDSDELILTGPASQAAVEMDRIAWGDGAGFPDPTGASMSLDPDFTNVVDNDDGANWCVATSAFGDGDLGTPGAVNDECDAEPEPEPEPMPPVELVINEIMRNPDAAAKPSGEWFEIYNPNPDPVDIDGWTIADNETDSHVIDNDGSLLVPAGGYVVLGNDADTDTNGGVTLDYVYSGITLDNAADELILLDTAMGESDRVEWDDGTVWPDSQGATMSLGDPTADNNDGANWCEASSSYGDGDLGTPGSSNDSCVAAPPPPPPTKVKRGGHHSRFRHFHVPRPRPKPRWHWRRGHFRCQRF
jgi:hypothetical protein